jgi:hypothetical protein
MSTPAGVPAEPTIGRWLDHLVPAPPAALHARLRELLGVHLDRPVEEVAMACLEVGEARLASLLAERATDRGSALDLLSIDALVTYAFEALAESPDRLEAVATGALARIAETPEAS